MTSPIWLRRTGRMLSNNSTSILSAAAVGGVVVTAILAVRAARRIDIVLQNDEQDLSPALFHTGYNIEKTKVMVQMFWRDYIPPVAAGLATIACIVGANRIGLRKQAATLGAYTIADAAFREYKREVVDLLGEKKEREVQDKVAIRKMEEDPPKDNEVVLLGVDEQLCYDVLSGRYFKSDVETIRRAANEINALILNGEMYASLNEFWAFLGLDSTTLGEELGFNIEHRIELVFTSHLAKNGVPCLAVGYSSLPVADYGKF
jgi:hypothetical protein